MTEVDFPTPVVKLKPCNPAIEQLALNAGLPPIIARIVAARPVVNDLPIRTAIAPKLKHLFLPNKMADMEHAANRLATAIMQGECIGIETDHDCDGQTSHAVIYHNLIMHFGHPKEKIRSYIGHRLTEGYGLSESVASRILADLPKPSLVITADNGSSDELRIKKLKDSCIDVIVTDHHQIPLEGYPHSAVACLNPTRTDCEYGDPYIAGCMVAWLLMAATRQRLIALHYLPNSAPALLDTLDFVAVGTVADCVSMARSVNNRAVVNYGLRLINAATRPCWRIIKENVSKPLCSEDLGFRVGPLLNSDGRLASAFGSVSFLLAESDDEAKAWLLSLQEQNTTRKAIQQQIVAQGLVKAKEQVDAGRLSLCIYLAESHPGVHGIAASRIKDIFGRPTVFLALKHGIDKLITGSVRGIENFHVRDALQAVADQHPLLLVAFGGHKGAGGLTLKLQDFDIFYKAFEDAVQLQLAGQLLGPVVWTDGPLSINQLSLELFEALSVLEPFGREFEAPLFELTAHIKNIQMIGDGTHARVQLGSDGRQISGVWFKMRQNSSSPMPVAVGDKVNVVFVLKDNSFRNQRTLDIHIHHISVI